ncbi:1-(5-phosphoribosyl)-5-[(5-phosphoribosylamino) methylideneamino] imidazole-4-carboxamide isomerase, chloroplastic [Galdieria sulphuraria]|uniref:1-(5-phosphoribosyl)-5-[(5-phosphoribosylamino)methylideneamino]imidazole-4-carboxamideisomerase n=1 Tax=Galdieria sulphuraria TaxID=130081 RepID=M2W2U7_GALSU|nr:phosphoribosylformimino-5-aminoimidazole carboxamide ribotide isomerase [Galdieria sulphuraria]EME30021.1 phosphoribosylformimino-5-aminoimidazole carboxamide ribotide isomerase [Galdieria sulphuraria]GJD06233.1 1-(5-phosphoribosyl)-5-[(5-phosphoribosylamino) methylideneamino] imidazole-4-carboxamide isomerase, chloroplastic [Galdieria sulphuraria]|eukprot:XP_005706541.1 phosphoribosylformimino-5-aminoimidazole carboxamide ribotide isomerase [Galdieria sulphuraria]
MFPTGKSRLLFVGSCGHVSTKLRQNRLQYSLDREHLWHCKRKRFHSFHYVASVSASPKRNTRFRPCIDIHEGKVKQIVGSSLNDQQAGKKNLITNFESELEPDAYARRYARDELYGGHVIMLGNGNVQAAKAAIQAFPQGLQVGGGITPQNAEFWLMQGASHVIITSYVFRDGHFYFERLEQVAKLVHPKRLVLDLSARKIDGHYFVCTNLWQILTKFQLNDQNLNLLSDYCDEFLVHAVDMEGKKQGIDRDLVSLLSDYSPKICTYAGGIRNMEDVELIEKLGKGRVDFTVGSALDLFGGSMSYDELVKWQHLRMHRVD